MKSIKPMGKKNYGSIPHFSFSQIGPGEHHITKGQEIIATRKARDRNDLVIVQEKLDGSNVGVTFIDGKITAISRAGYECSTSPHEQHLLFDYWVNEPGNICRFANILGKGERACGEWLVQAHGTIYNLTHEPLVLFDIFTADNIRLPYHKFLLRVLREKFIIPRLIHIGQPFPIKKAMEAIKESGHGAVGGAEGFIYRVERNGKVDFLAKYIPPGREVGKYLQYEEPVWNNLIKV